VTTRKTFDWKIKEIGSSAEPEHMPKIDDVNATNAEMAKVAIAHGFKTDVTQGLNLLYGVVLRDDTKRGHSADLVAYDSDGESQKIRVKVINPIDIHSALPDPNSPTDHHIINKHEPVFVAARGSGAPPRAQVGDEVVVSITDLKNMSGGIYVQNLTRGGGSTNSRANVSGGTKSVTRATKVRKAVTNPCLSTPTPATPTTPPATSGAPAAAPPATGVSVLGTTMPAPAGIMYPATYGTTEPAIIIGDESVKGFFGQVWEKYLKNSGWGATSVINLEDEYGIPGRLKDFAGLSPTTGSGKTLADLKARLVIISMGYNEPPTMQGTLYIRYLEKIIGFFKGANSNVMIHFIGPIINTADAKISRRIRDDIDIIADQIQLAVTNRATVPWFQGHNGTDMYNDLLPNFPRINYSANRDNVNNVPALTPPQAIELVGNWLRIFYTSGTPVGTAAATPPTSAPVPASATPLLLPAVAFAGASGDLAAAGLSSIPAADWTVGGAAYNKAMAVTALKDAYHKNCLKGATAPAPRGTPRTMPTTPTMQAKKTSSKFSIFAYRSEHLGSTAKLKASIKIMQDHNIVKLIWMVNGRGGPWTTKQMKNRDFFYKGKVRKAQVGLKPNPKLLEAAQLCADANVEFAVCTWTSPHEKWIRSAAAMLVPLMKEISTIQSSVLGGKNAQLIFDTEEPWKNAKGGRFNAGGKVRLERYGEAAQLLAQQFAGVNWGVTDYASAAKPTHPVWELAGLSNFNMPQPMGGGINWKLSLLGTYMDKWEAIGKPVYPTFMCQEKCYYSPTGFEGDCVRGTVDQLSNEMHKFNNAIAARIPVPDYISYWELKHLTLRNDAGKAFKKFLTEVKNA
tara:strand:+ start:610 stop:3162 length:2553 start_codon:yes stop_codon:yes gene_type:complete